MHEAGKSVFFVGNELESLIEYRSGHIIYSKFGKFAQPGSKAISPVRSFRCTRRATVF